VRQFVRSASTGRTEPVKRGGTIGSVNVSMNVRMSPVSNDRCDLLCIDLPRAEELRNRRLEFEAAEAAAARARALADPTRLMLAVALREGGELCVCDLAWISERSQNLVSHHLRALRQSGLARSRRDGKMVMYSLSPEGEALVAATVAAEAEVAPRRAAAR